MAGPRGWWWSGRTSNAISDAITESERGTPRPFKVPIFLGPTGIGKSRIAFEVARELSGEIVVADSRQVYRELDIATNKPDPDWRRQVRYHMIDLVPPTAG